MRAPRILVHAFPGFLGLPGDLDFLAPHLREIRGCPVEWRISLVDPAESEGWEAWTQRWLKENPATEGCREVLLGYSLGGRAAVHLAAAAPERFRGLVAISTNPGLTQDWERLQRLAADEAWARRFEEENWRELLEAWDSQPAFGGSALPDRLKGRARFGDDEFRGRCIRQLRGLSLGRQADLAPRLASLEIHQAWMTGERDLRFTEFARRLGEGSKIRRVVVPLAGHRWPWELGESEAAAWVARALEKMTEELPQ